MSKKLILNSLSGTTLYAINIVVAFVLSPVMIRALGNRDYGLWELVMSVIGYMGLMDLGIGPALVRFVAVADGRKDRHDLQQTISTAFAFFLTIGVASLTLFIGLGYSPGIIAGSESKDIANIGTVFLLLGVNSVLMFPMQVFIAALMGVQRHYFINAVRCILTIVRAVVTFYLLQNYPGKGLIVMALLTPFFNAVQFVLMVFAVRCDDNIPRMEMAAVTLQKLRELMTFGAKSATMMVASRLQNQSVPLIIGHVIGLGHIVYFVMPNRLIDYAKGMSQAIGFPLTPYFGASVGKGDNKELLRSWLNTTLALQIISLAMPIVIFFYGETFLTLWLGPEYAAAGHWIIYILLMGLVADSLATNAVRILTAHDRHGKSAFIWLLFAGVSVPLSVWGASLWGVVGVTLGTVLVTVFGNLATVFLACSVMKISLKTYFRNTFLRVAPSLILLFSVLWLLTSFFTVSNYLDMFAQLCVAVFIYTLAVCWLTLGSEVRDRVFTRMKTRFAGQ